jgi:hypothetical protein
VDAHAVEPAVTSERQRQSVTEETAEEGTDFKPQGWISSLFVNNPDIPVFAHHVVKPISEPVFSSQNFRDLPIHPFMVSDLLLYCILKVQLCRESWDLKRWGNLVS